MKKFDIRFLLVLIISVFMISSCDDDEGISPFIGDYTIEKAVTNAPVEMNVLVNGVETSQPLTVGYDITDMIKSAILTAIPTCSVDASLIELNEDGKLVMSCSESGASVDAGTWVEKDGGKTIVLSFSSNVLPAFPTGLDLEVNNITLENNILTSSAIVPIAKEVLAELVAANSTETLTLELSPNNPDFFTFSFNLTMAKVN